MASFNKVLLMGNLTADPEVKQLPSGMSVADLRLAVSEKYKSKSGEDIEKTCFVDVVVWDRQAENCGKYLSKGSSIFVEGKLQLDEWEKDGQKRSKIRVRANSVRFMKSASPAAAAVPAPVANTVQNNTNHGDTLDDEAFPF
jgi:single-strand DNA-binding protein